MNFRQQLRTKLVLLAPFNSMIRLSKLGDYAVLLMSCLASCDKHTASARTLSNATQVSMPTAMKLLKMLVANGTVDSIQGRSGGYRLTRPPADIPLAEIIEAVEGPIALTECNLEASDCYIQSHCRMRKQWQVINGAFRQALSGINLADLTGTVIPLKRVRL